MESFGNPITDSVVDDKANQQLTESQVSQNFSDMLHISKVDTDSTQVSDKQSTLNEPIMDGNNSLNTSNLCFGNDENDSIGTLTGIKVSGAVGQGIQLPASRYQVNGPMDFFPQATPSTAFFAPKEESNDSGFENQASGVPAQSCRSLHINTSSAQNRSMTTPSPSRYSSGCHSNSSMSNMPVPTTQSNALSAVSPSHYQPHGVFPQVTIGHRQEVFSRKVFVGGLPQDIGEVDICDHFRQFGQLSVDWPHKAETNNQFPPKGYCFLLFEQQDSVNKLVAACDKEEKPSSKIKKIDYYYYVSSSSVEFKRIQVRPFSLNDVECFYDLQAKKNDRLTVFVGGLQRTMTARELASLMNDHFGVVAYAGIDIDSEYKYPKGAGRVTFAEVNSYYNAIRARFAILRPDNDADKRVELKAYVLDDIKCDICNNEKNPKRSAPYLCVEELMYFCENCWGPYHQKDSSIVGHRKVTKETSHDRREKQAQLQQQQQYNQYGQNNHMDYGMFNSNAIGFNGNNHNDYYRNGGGGGSGFGNNKYTDFGTFSANDEIGQNHDFMMYPRNNGSQNYLGNSRQYNGNSYGNNNNNNNGYEGSQFFRDYGVWSNNSVNMFQQQQQQQQQQPQIGMMSQQQMLRQQNNNGGNENYFNGGYNNLQFGSIDGNGVGVGGVNNNNNQSKAASFHIDEWISVDHEKMMNYKN